MSTTERMKKQLDQWREIYYNTGERSVPDEVYDELLRKYEAAVASETGETPHRPVGAYVRDIYNRVQHKKPMLSLKDIFSKQELYTWLKTCRMKLRGPVAFMVEWKNDGLALSLHYTEGKLDLALLRGDGMYGEDVTQSFKKATTGWEEIVGFTGEIRGEGVVLKETFDQYHKDRSDKDPEYSTERHMAAGVIRNQNSKPNLMTFLPYDRMDDSNQNDKALWLETLSNRPVLLGQFQFSGDDTYEDWEKESLVSKFIDQACSDRPSLSWLTDGLVFKVAKFDDQKALGMSSSWPHWAVAYKFPPEGQWSTLKDVYWQVGRTGRLTPVSVIDTVNVSGVDITNPTLHNYAEIERLNLKIGSKVYVERRGDVIPKITYAEGGDGQIDRPERCPECDEPTTLMVTNGGDEEPICINNRCIGMLTQKFVYITGSYGLKINGLGSAYIQTLVRNGVLYQPIDLFKMTDTDLLNADIPEKIVRKIRKGIERFRQLPIEKWIFIQCLPGIGAATSKKYMTVDRFLSSKEWKTLKEGGFNIDVDEWLTLVNIEPYEIDDDLTSVYITGTVDVGRSEAKAMLREVGFVLETTFSGRVPILLVGNKPSTSKLEKANERRKLIIYGEPPILANMISKLLEIW